MREKTTLAPGWAPVVSPVPGRDSIPTWCPLRRRPARGTCVRSSKSPSPSSSSMEVENSPCAAQASTNGAEDIVQQAELERRRLLRVLLRGRSKPSSHKPPLQQPMPPRGMSGGDGDDLVWTCVQLPVEDEVAPPLQRRVTLTLLRRREGAGRHQLERRRPAVLLLHGTGGDRHSHLPQLMHIARTGAVAVSADLRYHGERRESAQPLQEYYNALIRAYNNNVIVPNLHSSDDDVRSADGNEYPFIYDNACDMIAVCDYLSSLDEVDPERLAITGVSLGGMVAYFAAAVDVRWAFCAPMIGVQGFLFAVERKLYNERVATMQPLFDHAAASADAGEGVDAEVVREVWRRITPGLCERHDAIVLHLIAPRPCLVLGGALDPRCPEEGVRELERSARQMYEKLGAGHNLWVVMKKDTAHDVTSEMLQELFDWLDHHVLRPEGMRQSAL